jgi:hypothetical protein
MSFFFSIVSVFIGSFINDAIQSQKKRQFQMNINSEQPVISSELDGSHLPSKVSSGVTEVSPTEG